MAEAETSLATVKFNYDWDWAGAAQGFQQAIQHNPSYATAYQRYSLYLSAMGRSEDSFEQINKARELDPLSISINFSLGWRLYMARQYDRAIQQLRNTLEMDPSYELPHLVSGHGVCAEGRFQDAIPEIRQAVGTLARHAADGFSAGQCLCALGQQSRSGEDFVADERGGEKPIPLALLLCDRLCGTGRQRNCDQLA